MARASWEEQYLHWERVASRSPGTFRLHLRMWTALGTFFPLMLAIGLLVLALLISAGVAYLSWYLFVKYPLWLRFGVYVGAIPVGIVLALWHGTHQIVKSLFATQIPPPDGVLLTRADAPRLFRILDQMCQRMDTYPIEEVVIVPEMTAAVAPWTARTALRRIRYTLILGLPLMDILSPDQMRAVVAHELAHLVRSNDQHGTLARALRLYWFWKRMLDLAESDEQGAFVAPAVLSFYSRFLPRFHLLSQVAERQYEQYADRVAAAIGTPKAYGDALILLALGNRWLAQVFWNRILEEELYTIINPFDSLRQSWEQHYPSPRFQRWLGLQLLTTNDPNDPHPSLRNRLRTMGYLPAQTDLLTPAKVELPPSSAETASEFLLGDSRSSISQSLFIFWHDNILPQWRQTQQQIREAKGRLAVLEGKTSLSEEQIEERLTLAANFRSREQAIADAQSVLQSHPQHAAAHYVLGGLLIDEQPEQAIPLLERAMQLDESYIVPACELLAGYWAGQGDWEKADHYRRRGQQHYEKVSEAIYERTEISPDDPFESADITPAQALALRRYLWQYEQIRAAYLVRKVVKQYTDEPLYVLALRLRSHQFTQQEAALLEQVAQQLPVSPPLSRDRIMVLALVHRFAPLTRRLQQIRKATLFER
ncbi:MAG: hypothetical protein KatS3mg023_2610 [Armatimonadota bacterium]|nr:MAG: hypothetical protein KatS3mg023_2610 [Armatimonadota bacterium]